jgi:hypothetical protein
MAARTQLVYIDDTDAFVSWTVTDTQGQNLDWANPQIALGTGTYGTAAWQGAAAPTREIRLTASAWTALTAGTYPAYLKVPGGNDFNLGAIQIANRT